MKDVDCMPHNILQKEDEKFKKLGVKDYRNDPYHSHYDRNKF